MTQACAREGGPNVAHTSNHTPMLATNHPGTARGAVAGRSGGRAKVRARSNGHRLHAAPRPKPNTDSTALWAQVCTLP